jgi:hypothetical protein
MKVNFKKIICCNVFDFACWCSHRTKPTIQNTKGGEWQNGITASW